MMTFTEVAKRDLAEWPKAQFEHGYSVTLNANGSVWDNEACISFASFDEWAAYMETCDDEI